MLERITGGAGPGGVKAVAPVGTEPITLQLPAELAEVTILGEKLTVLRADGQSSNYSASGRPIAIISDVTVEYTPAPARALNELEDWKIEDWENVVGLRIVD